MSPFASHVPTSVSNLPFASPALAKVAKALSSGQLFEHLLLHGDPGTGKTTIVEAILRQRHPAIAHDLGLYVYEGATWDSNSLSRVLGQMNMDIPAHGISQAFTIINEVDQVGKRMATLKAFMDRWPCHKFLMTTNHIEKVDESIQSRCNVYEVKLPPPALVTPFLQKVVASHGRQLSSRQAQVLIDNCNGDWRRLERATRSLL